jgi:hypothetical protein
METRKRSHSEECGEYINDEFSVITTPEVMQVGAQ